MFKKILVAAVIFNLLCANAVFAATCGINFEEKINYINPQFWKSFNDEYLYDYITRAIKHNHNAKKAVWSVEESRQRVKVNFAKELPLLTVQANYLGLHVPQLDDFTLTKNAFILPFLANWELDLLRKNHDKTRSAKKSYLAQKDEERGIYISLASEVGTTYFNILKYDKMIELQQQYIKNLQAYQNRLKNSFQYGVADITSLNDTSLNLYQASTDLEDLKSYRDTALYQLGLLIGDFSLGIENYERSDIEKFYDIKNEIPIISSDVIYSRPDVLAAEKKLQAARLDIKTARKDLFPRFNLTGILTFNTLNEKNFFSWNSIIAYLIAGAGQDLFAGGKKIATLRMQKAKFEQMFEEYKNTDLNALKEINTALCNLKYDKNVFENSFNRNLIESNNFERTQRRLNAGTISVSDYLIEENSLITIQQNMINSKTTNLIDYITLYKASGGEL